LPGPSSSQLDATRSFTPGSTHLNEMDPIFSPVLLPRWWERRPRGALFSVGELRLFILEIWWTGKAVRTLLDKNFGRDKSYYSVKNAPYILPWTVLSYPRGRSREAPPHCGKLGQPHANESTAPLLALGTPSPRRIRLFTSTATSQPFVR
jgi:hypothetical protein